VNLFDYDVPYQYRQEWQSYPWGGGHWVDVPIDGTFDFTHSGPLDVESNVASNPNNNNNINNSSQI
jgi:hypothetical protein